MRQRLLTALMLVLLLLEGITDAAASKGFLLFSGKITSSQKAVSQATVQLFRNNQEVTSFSTKTDGLFSLYLELNSVYEIRISSSLHKSGLIKLSTSLPSEITETKFELSADISLERKSEKGNDYTAFIWYNKQDKKFVLSPNKSPVVISKNDVKPNTVKNPNDPERIYGNSEKTSSAQQSAAEKERQNQIKNNTAVKSEVNASLVKGIVEAEKKRNDQTNAPCNEERVEQDRYKISTSFTLCEGNSKARFRKVEYKWGSAYYYKNGIQITEKEFDKEFSKIKTKEK